MKVLVDTHVLVWAEALPEKLSAAARDVLTRPGTTVAVSALSVYELSVLIDRGRIGVSGPAEAWIREALQRSAVEVLPVTAEIAYRARLLGGYPAQDPFDRMIVATALEHSLPLVTADEVIRGWAGLQVIW